MFVNFYFWYIVANTHDISQWQKKKKKKHMKIKVRRVSQKKTQYNMVIVSFSFQKTLLDKRSL